MVQHLFTLLDWLAEKGTPNRFLGGSKSMPIFPGVAVLQNQHEANASDMKTAYSRYLNTWDVYNRTLHELKELKLLSAWRSTLPSTQSARMYKLVNFPHRFFRELGFEEIVLLRRFHDAQVFGSFWIRNLW